MVNIGRTMKSMGLSKGALSSILWPIILLGIIYIYLTKKGYIGGVNHFDRQQPHYKTNSGAPAAPLPQDTEAKPPSEKDLYEALARMESLRDYRAPACRSQGYQTTNRVSIIIDFSDFQLDEVKLTIGSVLIHTPHHLIQEIILVDDGSTIASIIAESSRYASKTDKVRVVRTGMPVGASKARTMGADEAKAPILVFLESTVIVNKGWLEPLIDHINKEPDTIAVPHFDRVKDPYQLDVAKTPDELITTFTWSLTMRVSHSPEKQLDVSPINSPVTRGNMFVMRKKFFKDIGGFDTDMNDLVYEIMELSFRTWMCGGAIKVVPCSRVAVFNLDDPIHLNNKGSIQRLVELWFHGHRHFVYNILELKADNSKSIENRRTELNSQLRCNDFEWYLHNVATHIVTPSRNAKFYGLLKCRSGRCARVGEDHRLLLGRCKPEDYELHPSAMFFELDSEKRLHVAGKCVTVQRNAHILVLPCDPDNEQQIWEYEPAISSQLRNPWSKYCAMHVTDPDDPNELKQIAMVQQCGEAATFNTWEFVEV